MGKPIAGRNKLPFGVDGVAVQAAVLADGTKLTDVRISKQRSINQFDLISKDGSTVYPFMKITGTDSSGADLSVSSSAADLADDLAPGSFCLGLFDESKTLLGFIVRLMSNKVALQGKDSVFYKDLVASSDGTISVVSVAFASETASVVAGSTVEVGSAITPANATNLNRTFTTSNAAVATVAAKAGSAHVAVVSGVAAGTATITVTTADGSKTDTFVVTVTASA